MANNQQLLSLEALMESFPHGKYPHMRPSQQQALEILAQTTGSTTLEAPTGSGKTDIGATFLRTLQAAGEGPLYYIVPNKALVDQVASLCPDFTRAYGRNEYDCLYYEEEAYRADDVPCLSLKACPHRVDQQTGLTLVEGATPCPYYQAKFEAKQAPIVVCTFAYYLYTHLFARERKLPAGLVIDEVHQLAKVVRSALSYEITDLHLKRSIKLLRRIGAPAEADGVQLFLDALVSTLRRKPQSQSTLLQDNEIARLMDVVGRIDANALRRLIAEGIASGQIDPVEDRTTLKQLESITYDLGRYVHSLDYALPETGRRGALNYVTYAYSEEEYGDDRKAQYRLIIKAYYAAPIIRALLPERTLAYSATIGNPDIFGFETGIQFPFHSLTGSFPAENARVMMPTNTPNLSKAKRSRQDVTKTLRRVARGCKSLGERDLRCLVVVISEQEREKFLWLCNDEGISAMSYGGDVTARQALEKFKEGEGQVLVGTVANFGEGIDLPGSVAKVTFFLRPGYPSPMDPATQFEERRFGGQRWKLWQWRAMIESLQVRGRNIRSVDDRGVTIFMSQQFRGFLYGSLPTWLRDSYRGDLTFDECIEEAIALLA